MTDIVSASDVGRSINSFLFGSSLVLTPVANQRKGLPEDLLLPIEIDNTFSFNPTFSAEVPQSPVESFSTVVDSVLPSPTEISLECGFSSIPVNIENVLAGNAVGYLSSEVRGKFGAAAGALSAFGLAEVRNRLLSQVPPAQRFERLVNARARGIIFDVNLSNRTYKSFVIRSLSSTTTESGDGLLFTMNLVEVRVTSSQVVSAIVRKKVAAKREDAINSETVKTGLKSTKDAAAKAGENQSWLRQSLNKALEIGKSIKSGISDILTDRP